MNHPRTRCPDSEMALQLSWLGPKCHRDVTAAERPHTDLSLDRGRARLLDNVDAIADLQIVEELLGVAGGQMDAAMGRSRKAPSVEAHCRGEIDIERHWRALALDLVQAAPVILVFPDHLKALSQRGVALCHLVATAALAVPAWPLLRPLTVVIVIVIVPVMVPIPVVVVVVVVMVAVPAAPIAVPDVITLCVRACLAFVVILGADAQVLGEDLSDRVVFEILARGFPGLAVAVVHCSLPGQLPDRSVPLDHAGQCPAEALHVLVDVGAAPPYMLQMATSDEHSCVELRRLP